MLALGHAIFEAKRISFKKKKKKSTGDNLSMVENKFSLLIPPVLHIAVLLVPHIGCSGLSTSDWRHLKSGWMGPGHPELHSANCGGWDWMGFKVPSNQAIL